MRISDWSSDVCSSDLPELLVLAEGQALVAVGIELAQALAAGLVDLLLAQLAVLVGVVGIEHAEHVPAVVSAFAMAHAVVVAVVHAVGLLRLARAGRAAALGLGGRSEAHTSELQSLMRISY